MTVKNEITGSVLQCKVSKSGVDCKLERAPGFGSGYGIGGSFKSPQLVLYRMRQSDIRVDGNTLSAGHGDYLMECRIVGTGKSKSAACEIIK